MPISTAIYMLTMPLFHLVLKTGVVISDGSEGQSDEPTFSMSNYKRDSKGLVEG